MPIFNDLIVKCADAGHTDIHMTGGHPLVFRKDGLIRFDKHNQWSHQDVDKLVRNLLTPDQLDMLRRRQSVDFSRSIHHIRVRLNVFNTTRGLSLAVRLLPGKPPAVENLNLHPCIQEYAKLTSGLILICGASGNGKSSTIAAMLEVINQNRAAHIITLEDPIEYRFVSRRSFIEQRELGCHFPTFAQGLLDVLREDPDVVVVGELREPETIRLTINAAEAGHLVLASMHATNTVDGLYRICNAFPPEGQDVIRAQLASTLSVMVIQQLVPMEKVGFRVPLLTVLRGTQAVRSSIRDNRFTQIEGIIQTASAEGMFTPERYRSEYLDTRSHFHPPTMNFRPSAEVTPEILYRSPLLGQAPAGRPGSEPAPQASREAPRPAPARSRETDDLLVLDDESSMDEVLARLNT